MIEIRLNDQAPQEFRDAVRACRSILSHKALVRDLVMGRHRAVEVDHLLSTKILEYAERLPGWAVLPNGQWPLIFKAAWK